jgi:hypothetical protein
MTDPSATEFLRLTNGRVYRLLERMLLSEREQMLVKQQDFDALLGEVSRTAVWLQRMSPFPSGDVELEAEIASYRRSLEQLQQILPAIHQRLLAEKVRLETNSLHLTAATGWANTTQGTL